MAELVFFQRKLQLIVILLWGSKSAFTDDTCIVRLVGGKMTNFGNCQKSRPTYVSDGIREKADEELARAPVGSVLKPGKSCKDMKQRNLAAQNGLFYLQWDDGNLYQTYCDMTIAGGGWTLVSSIHENDIDGKCTQGDRWSSEQGSSDQHINGDGFWQNNATYGTAVASTRDDYKNPGYFSLSAADIMIWHVPNNTPFSRIASSAFFKYHTTNGFLSTYGGNLANLYGAHYPMRSQTYSPWSDMGPAIPITWDVGNTTEYLSLLGPKMREEVDGGFVQFRALNHEQNAYALCSGVKIKPLKANVEHACVGSTSSNVSDNAQYCGDFTGFSLGDGWFANQTLIDAVIMIFYK